MGPCVVGWEEGAVGDAAAECDGVGVLVVWVLWGFVWVWVLGVEVVCVWGWFDHGVSRCRGFVVFCGF